MPFTDRFQLLDLKRDEGARTYEAREIATGRPVFVHVFDDCAAPLNRALLSKLDTLPEEELHRIIDRGPHEGGMYLVTDRLAEYPGLSEWLKAKNDERRKSLETRGAWQLKPPAPSPAAVDEATVQMRVPVEPPPLPPQLAPPPPPPLPPPPPALKPLEEPRVSPFDTAPLPTMEPSIVTPPPVSPLGNSGEQTLQIPKPADPPPAPPAANEPGEFTRQFAPPVMRPVTKEAAAPPACPTPAANEPGEFTRQFAPPILHPAPPPPTAAAPEPGEFTRMFAAPAKPAPPPKPSAPPSGEFTRQFQAPQRPATPPSAPRVPTPPPQNPAAPPAGQPGEFTQMLQAQRPASPAPAKLPNQSGEFARYFQSPMTPAQGPTHPAPLTPPARPPSHPKDAGEFTQVFGRGDIPSPPPPQAPAAPPNLANANATQVFATPRPNTQVPNLQVPMGGQNLPQNMGSPTPARQPGEYTQMFAKPSSLTFGQPPAQRMPDPIPIKRNKSRLPLLLVTGAVVLLIVAVVVYFVMRPHTS